MKNLFTKPFLGVLAFDASMLICVILMYGYGLNIWLILVFLAVALKAGKTVKTIVPTLSNRQKRVRLMATFGGVLLMIALVLRWALRVNNGASWAMSSLAFIVLLALAYAAWDQLNDELKVIPANTVSADQPPDPTAPSVTPPAGAGRAPSVAADH